MDSVERVHSAIAMVEEARGVPLSASCVVHRGELLDLLDGVRSAFHMTLQLPNRSLILVSKFLKRQGRALMP
ncbi:MAG: hypothetical protein WDN07_02935 [Actinomycetota bacterium]